jgi:Nucleotidyl transferase AbiEii toxin, Type IV TA system
MALEQRLHTRSTESGISLDRLRRRVIFERIVARLQAAEPGAWVLKGGMALEVRLGDAARLTKDIDLGLRDDAVDGRELRDRLVEALAVDPYHDGFLVTVGAFGEMTVDRSGTVTWRANVATQLAGKPFGAVRVDISPRTHELWQTEIVSLPNSLAFAGIDAPAIEIIDVHRHAAEKFHGMLKDFGEHENSRVRDLIDLVILIEHHLLDPSRLAAAVEQVWREREGSAPPAQLPVLPPGWPHRYEQIAADHHLGADSFDAAFDLVSSLWTTSLRDQGR